LTSIDDRLAAALILVATILVAVVVKFRSPSRWIDVLLVLALLGTVAALTLSLLHA
jgi:hypothetical protein